MDMNGYETSKLCMRVWYFVIAVYAVGIRIKTCSVGKAGW
jgi:hypothetical protein